MRRAEPRWVFPSMAIGLSSGGSSGMGVKPCRFISAVIQSEKHFWKASRVEQTEDAAEGVVRRDAPRQGQEGLEPVVLGLGVVGDLLPAIGPTQDGADGHEDDLVEQVDSSMVASRIGKRGAIKKTNLVRFSHVVKVHQSRRNSDGQTSTTG